MRNQFIHLKSNDNMVVFMLKIVDNICYRERRKAELAKAEAIPLSNSPLWTHPQRLCFVRSHLAKRESGWDLSLWYCPYTRSHIITDSYKKKRRVDENKY